MKDEMKPQDKEVKVELKCAKCGEAVKPNEQHVCKEEEK